ncbi:MAG: ATP synthase F1 gamma subunit [Lysobacterales bacterium]|jgi:ATP synthase F1 gamma subunit
MGKANLKKIELLETGEMVGLIQTLKDIADSKYYTLLSEKEKLRRFGETFVEFFRLISLTEVSHPLIKNDNKKMGILVISGEGSFLGKFNSSIFLQVEKTREKHEDHKIIGVGEKSMMRYEHEEPNLKVFSGYEKVGLYEMAVQIKDYLVDEIVNDRLGRVSVVYSWPKTSDIQKPRTVPLLPCADIVSKQVKFVDEFENVIEESNPKEIIGMLSNIWVTSRIYEILMDVMIASAAAQAAFLDDSVDKMKKEEVKARAAYRKAKKSDIDKSLREIFSARLIANKA